MLVVLSPAKNLDFESPLPTRRHTKAALLDHAEPLVGILRDYAPHELSKLMSISDKLGVLNYDRYQAWSQPFTTRNARPAMFAFNGDVYAGLEAYTFSDEDIEFAQQHVRILSGLYGVLRPLDLMQAYRLEMGTKLANPEGKDLYAYWGETITDVINKQLRKLNSQTLLNLASNEYFKSVKSKALGAQVITPVFKDLKNGQYKIISFFAKKARGRMSAYIVRNKITDVAHIREFDWDGYAYNEALSSESNWVFTRDATP